jgi:hypothetical protein
MISFAAELVGRLLLLMVVVLLLAASVCWRDAALISGS